MSVIFISPKAVAFGVNISKQPEATPMLSARKAWPSDSSFWHYIIYSDVHRHWV